MEASDRTPPAPAPAPLKPLREQVERWEWLNNFPLDDVPDELLELMRRRHGSH